VTAMVAAAALFVTPAEATPPVDVDMSCVTPAGDPQPNTPEWIQRDTQNQYCASLRNRDQLLNSAFGYGNVTEGAALWEQQMAEQAADPFHPRGGVTTVVPGSRAADPFRTIERSTEQGRGSVAPVSLRAPDRAPLRGHVLP